MTRFPMILYTEFMFHLLIQSPSDADSSQILCDVVIVDFTVYPKS